MLPSSTASWVVLGDFVFDVPVIFLEQAGPSKRQLRRVLFMRLLPKINIQTKSMAGKLA
jgi:hypothetical protein